MVKGIEHISTIIQENFVKILGRTLIFCIAISVILSCLFPQYNLLIWESTALIVFALFNAILLCTGLSKNNSWTVAFEDKQDIIKVMIWYFPIIVLFGCAFLTMYLDRYILHLSCVLLLSCIFSRIDLFVTSHAKLRKDKENDENMQIKIHIIHDEFEKTFHFIDIPTVIGFLVLLVTYSIRYSISIDSVSTFAINEHFIGGAIAFQLVASVVIFLSIARGNNRQLFIYKSDSTNN